MAERLVVFGSGGHAKVVIEAILALSPQREIVIIDDSAESQGRTILGIKVTGTRSLLPSVTDAPVALAIGDNRTRAELMGWFRSQGISLETIIHPAAIVANSVEIGPGAFVSAGAIVIAQARIGAGAIINTGASVDHDCVIGEAAHIAPGVHLCGNVQVGDRTLVGVGAAVRPGISIGEDAVVGAGAVVVKNIATGGTFAGNPARRFD